MDINAVTLPSQSGNSGKYLTTDGSDASWGTVDLSTKVSKTGDTMTGDLIVNANVGVGASSPTHKFHLDNGTTDGTLFKINNEEVGLLLAVNGTGTTYGREVSLNATRVDAGSSPSLRLAGQGAIVFAVDANTERMRIDSSGRVTMPYQPAFFVWDSAPADNYFSGNYFLGNASMPNTVNIGSHWNFSTGRFTAPVAGTYIFSVTFSTNDANSHFVNIHKNGSLVGENVLQYSNTYTSASSTAILQLAVGDYVQAARRGTGYSIYSAHFSGFLIG
jgi:hypothetical protein